MMAEARRAAAAEQAVQRVRRVRQPRGELGRQVTGARVQRFLHPLRRLAGRRGQRDAQVRMRVEQAREHADDRGRLAGAGAAADDRHAARQCDDRRDALPVDVAGRRAEVACEAFAQHVGRQRIGGGAFAGLGDQRVGEPPFVVEIAREVETVVTVDDQRPLVATRERAERGDAARRERRAHVGERLVVALRERAERHAHMAAGGRPARRERGPRRPARRRGRRAGAARELADPACETFRERDAEIRGLRQPRGEAAGEFEQIVGRAHARPPSISRSSASTSSRAGRRACTPAGSPPLRQPGRTPRTNRYR